MRALNGLLMTICALLLACLATGAAQAQGAFGTGARHMRASLDAETQAPAPGSRVTLALVMRPDKGWHGYWQNPGDAGAGMVLDWSLPAGVRVGALRYPVPQRLVIAGLMNHVYEHDYAVLADLSVPADARPGTRLPVRAQGRWLVCTESLCVPEQGTVETVLTVGDGRIDPAARTRFDRYRAALPRPLDQAARYRQAGADIAIAIPYPADAPVADPWFYALTRDRIAYAQPQRARRAGDRLVIETRVSDGASAAGPIEGVLAVAPGLALQVRALPGPVPSGGDPVGGAPRAGALGLMGVLLAFGGAMLGGLILNVMPCVFPILSLKALSLARAGGDGRGARVEALAYTAGVLLACLVLGALMLALRAGGAQIGWAFQLQEPRVIALLLVLMVAITANLAGLFDIATIGGGTASSGAGGAFWTGALAAFVATPCTGPFMGAAMGAALVLPWPLALLVFAGLGLGLALPFLAVAFIPALRARLPRPGAWMNRLRHVLALPMGLTALALLWLLSRQVGIYGLVVGSCLALLAAALLAGLGSRQRRGRATAPLAVTLGILLLAGAAVLLPGLAGRAETRAVAGEERFSPARLAALRAQGRPVFLYFTADWCLTCKVNEAGALANAGVGAAFEKRGIVRMVGDWTSADPAITRFLEANGRSGVPLYLYYAPGAAQPQVLPQILTPALLAGLGA